MSDNHFDADVAARYDDECAELSTDTALAPMLDLLARLAGPGPVLELAIGTGRVALPLRRRGVPVHGIELSDAMVGRLRDKPGGDEHTIPVVLGDMTTQTAPGCGGYSLVYLVFNTVMNLTTLDAQVACFANAARHLASGGHFVVETMVPELRQLPPGSRFVPFDVSEHHVGLDEYEPATQRMVSHHVTTRDGVTERTSIPFRYVWPSELDLMARLAGLALAHRWADWDGSPFTDDSTSHVTVWHKSAG
jgi:SAM-dependent methyltransferase